MEKLKINHPAVILIVVFRQLLGMLWYSPFLFGNAWMRLAGLNPETVEPKAHMFLFDIAASFIGAYFLAWVFSKAEIKKPLVGMGIALFVWLGFVFFTTATHNAFSMRPFKLTLIDTGRELGAFIFAGALLAVWVKKFKEESEIQDS